MVATRLDESQIEQRMSGPDMADWHRTGDVLRRSIEVYDFSTAVNVVHDIVYHVKTLDRHPEVHIRGNQVSFVIRSDGGLTDTDLELAHRIEKAAGSHVRGYA
ncbi:4a-hydroxytetrahydrobiopterin dehydratase [Streptomyces sp. NPDC058067]|uniref:4a-hydroxytetrahydrobiopterin dehydratase n=1 Tax=Streptomyces sp. NPDC058067 TaxID=3346324 RepID=UPI0036E952A8